MGDYRFRADKNGTHFWSGESNHCTIPGCTSTTVTTTVPVVVTVEDSYGDPEDGLRVYAFDEATYSGYNQTTDASGWATFTLPQGDYRFRADKDGTQYWSAAENHCAVPGCTSAVITTTVQARIGRGKIFAAPLPWPVDATSLPETTAPASLRDNANGDLVTRTITYTYDALNPVSLRSRDVPPHPRRRVHLHVQSTGRMVRAASVTSTVVYTYTANGLRVAQNVDGAETMFTWDWASGVPELLVHSLFSHSPFLYLVGHDTLGWVAGANWTYALPDALGSVRQVADGAGAVTAAREWSPYGVEVGSTQGGLGYTGEWFDVGVGLQYLRARWYDNQTGRFQQADLWQGESQQPQTLHLYVYGYANPVKYTDPSGYIAEDEANEAEKIIAQLQDGYGFNIDIDFGIAPVRAPGPNDPSHGWDKGIWELYQLQFFLEAHQMHEQYTAGGLSALDYLAELADYRTSLGYPEVFVDDMSTVILGERGWTGVANPALHLNRWKPVKLNDSGFRDYFKDGSNQVRHFWNYVYVAYSLLLRPPLQRCTE